MRREREEKGLCPLKKDKLLSRGREDPWWETG
jgi:hypothetical protein